MKVKFEFSTAHFAKHLRPSHGPQNWSWWRLFSIKVVRQDIARPSTGRRMWFYTRWGAGYVGVYIDRRTGAR